MFACVGFLFSPKGVKIQGPEAIVATDLTKWFGEEETRTTAGNGVGLVAHFGEMLFIVGPSGSGKTTMLSMISGILRPNGHPDRRDFELCRGAEGPQNRAVRHLPGIRMSHSMGSSIFARCQSAARSLRSIAGYLPRNF